MPDRVSRFTVSERAVHWLTRSRFSACWSAASSSAAAAPFRRYVCLAFRVSRRARRWRGPDRPGGEPDGHSGTQRTNWAPWMRRTASGSEPFERACFPVAGTTAGALQRRQKVNFTIVCILLAILYVTGVDTIIAGTDHNLVFGGHKLATIALCVLVAGHLYMALFNRATRPALRGMLTGEVDREWAHKHYPRWEP